MQFNPHLKPWRQASPNQEAGKGFIENVNTVENIVWQTRPSLPGDYENALADALISCFEEGLDSIEELLQGLTERGIRTTNGLPYDLDGLSAELARLGK